MFKSSKLLDFASEWGAIGVFIYFVCAGMLGTSYEHMNNQQYKFTVIYIGPFIAIFIGYVTLYRFQFQEKLIQKLTVILGAVFAWIALNLGTAGIVATINSNIGSQYEICIAGEVLNKWNNSGFIGDSFNLEVFDLATNKLIAIDANSKDYYKYEVGSIYEECWNKGFLGLIYKK